MLEPPWLGAVATAAFPDVSCFCRRCSHFRTRLPCMVLYHVAKALRDVLMVLCPRMVSLRPQAAHRSAQHAAERRVGELQAEAAARHFEASRLKVRLKDGQLNSSIECNVGGSWRMRMFRELNDGQDSFDVFCAPVLPAAKLRSHRLPAPSHLDSCATI